MKNHIVDHSLAPKRTDQSPQPAFHELRNLAQRQIAHRLSQVESYVQEHLGTGIGAAFCTGIFLGWVIKRR
jgi:ElaB/YqjD/DUF883 family membrane-anchored ribosome-binding protein